MTPVIEHYVRGNVTKEIDCSYCPCFFSSKYDYIQHLLVFGRRPHKIGRKAKNSSLTVDGLDRLGWRPSKYDGGEWCSVKQNLDLKTMVIQRGAVTLGGYKYSVSKNGRWLKRKKIIR